MLGVALTVGSTITGHLQTNDEHPSDHRRDTSRGLWCLPADLLSGRPSGRRTWRLLIDTGPDECIARQYVSIRYSERLAEAGIEPSVGSKGDSYDNALTETINGLCKAELIHRRAPWKTKEAEELATLE